MWLHVDNHWLNMTRALIVDDDATSTPRAISVVFQGDVKRIVTGGARMAVLAWLEQQELWAQGGVVKSDRPYVVGEHL